MEASQERMPAGTTTGTADVVLVDEHDRELGVMEKLEAHRRGLLHRAFSVFLFDRRGRLLLQRRADDKYHSPGLWTNTCCSHPRPGEPVAAAASRRLVEEMGIRCPLRFAFRFVYRAPFDNGLTEHELDHVFVGRFDGEPRVDPEEVGAWRYTAVPRLEAELERVPGAFTEWFKLAWPRVAAEWTRGRPQHDG